VRTITTQGSNFVCLAAEAGQDRMLSLERRKAIQSLTELSCGQASWHDFNMKRPVDLTVAFVPVEADPQALAATAALMQKILPLDIEFSHAFPCFYDETGAITAQGL
jgi:hypothetical protein